MDNVLVFVTIITVISIVQSENVMEKNTDGLCYSKCQPGFYSLGKCKDSPRMHICVQCSEKTFTVKENTRRWCQRCQSCPAGEVVKNNCTFTNDTLCQCKVGYFRPDLENSCRSCEECIDGDDSVCRKKCQPCQRSECLINAQSKTKWETTAVPTSTDQLQTITTTASSLSATTVAGDNRILWPLVFGVTLLVFLWLVMLFTRSILRKTHSCFCWQKNKNDAVEAPATNEHCSLQGSSQTTLTFNIIEETPMMCSSENTIGSQPSAHTSHLLPAARHEDQSEHWPAIVLYAIIDVVPLRRWKEFLRLLSVADQQLERVELEAGLGQGFKEKQYQMLKLWSQRSSASLNEVFLALHNMGLSGCAQIVHDNLDKLPWKHKSKPVLLSCSDPTNCKLNEVVLDTKGSTSGM